MSKFVICVREKYLQSMFLGRKKFEIRTRIPSELSRGDIIYMVESASGGHVVGSFVVDRIVCCHSVEHAYMNYSDTLGVSLIELIQYVGNRDTFFLIGISDLKQHHNLWLEDLGHLRTPQWFVKQR